jgi:23S rRNA pseudouridine2604 synthase
MKVRIDGKLIHDRKEKPVYLAFNKPVEIDAQLIWKYVITL